MYDQLVEGILCALNLFVGQGNIVVAVKATTHLLNVYQYTTCECGRDGTGRTVACVFRVNG